MDDPALAKLFEDDLRANREAPVDRVALFAPPTPELTARRKAILAQIEAHLPQREIAPLTAADLIHEAVPRKRRVMAEAVDEPVLDASLAVAWHLKDEEHSALARQFLAALVAGELKFVAPQHIRYEVPNAITVAAQRRSRVSQAEARLALAEFLGLDIPTVTDDVLVVAAQGLTYQYGCAFYDAL